MSICNVLVKPDRIVMVVDTEILVGHDRHRCGKMSVLPHMSAVLAFRGTPILGGSLTVSAMAVSSFDELTAQFGELIKNTLIALPEITGGDSVKLPGLETLDTILGEDQEIFLGGWSEQRARMEAAIWRQKDGAGFERIPVEWGAYSPQPHENAATPIRAPETIDEHVAIAKAQARRLRAQGLAGGGDLVVATVTRGRIVVDVVRDFCGDLKAAGNRARGKVSTHGQ